MGSEMCIRDSRNEGIEIGARVGCPLRLILDEEVLDLLNFQLFEVHHLSAIVNSPRHIVHIFLEVCDEHAVVDDVEDHGAAHEEDSGGGDEFLETLQLLHRLPILLVRLRASQVSAVFRRHQLPDVALSGNLEACIINTNGLVQHVGLLLRLT